MLKNKERHYDHHQVKFVVFIFDLNEISFKKLRFIIVIFLLKKKTKMINY